MKIAIITLPLHTNYGGILQAYALQTVLERMGHDVVLLEPKRKPIHKKIVLPLVWIKRAFKKFILRKDIRLFKNPWLVVRENTEKFVRKHIKIQTITKWDDQLADSFDAFVVGSDQILRPCCCPNLGHTYLDFTSNKKVLRISYAASFGTSEKEYSKEEIEICKPLISKFDYVTVREKSGIDLIKDYFNANATVVLDPTMLLNMEDYIKLFKAENTPKSNGNFFVHVLDKTEEKSKCVKDIAESMNLIPFSVNSDKVDEMYAPISERIQPPVENWLRAFYDASIVFTDSFHACVFAMLFHKPFIVFGNATRGMARFNTLLETFSMQDRLVFSYEDFFKKRETLSKFNDFESFDKILEQRRADSMYALNRIGFNKKVV